MLNIRNAICAALFLGLSACQTIDDVGTGPINLSTKVIVAFETYKALDHSGFFSVSEDGNHYGVGVCPTLAPCYSDGRALSLRLCHERSGGIPCKIYASDRLIVWRGAEGEGQYAEVTKTEVGTGPIRLSSRVQSSLTRYLNLEAPLVFAVSVDGQNSQAIVCSNQPCTSPGAREAATALCQKRASGTACKIYAVEENIVWQGQTKPQTGYLAGSKKTNVYNALESGPCERDGGEVSCPGLLGGWEIVRSNNWPGARSAEYVAGQLSVTWDGVEPFSRNLSFLSTPRRAELDFKNASDTNCFAAIRSGTKWVRGIWSIYCEDGAHATGKFTGESDKTIFEGRGQDGKGRSVRFEFKKSS